MYSRITDPGILHAPHVYSKLCQAKCVHPNDNLNIVQLEPELWLKVPRPVDSAVIEIKYENDETGEDDPDNDNEVKESHKNHIPNPVLLHIDTALLPYCVKI